MIANIALPAFFPHSLATFLGIFVIAAIEGWFLMRGLKLPYAVSYRHALAANWRSTVAGIPLAWVLWMVGLVPVAYGGAALGIQPHPAVVSTLFQTALSGGAIPTEWTLVGSAGARLVLLVPFCMGSVWIERRTLKRRLPDGDVALLSKAVIRGNLASYSLFLILGVVALWGAMVNLPEQRARFEELREKQERSREQRSQFQEEPGGEVEEAGSGPQWERTGMEKTGLDPEARDGQNERAKRVANHEVNDGSVAMAVSWAYARHQGAGS